MPFHKAVYNLVSTWRALRRLHGDACAAGELEAKGRHATVPFLFASSSIFLSASAGMRWIFFFHRQIVTVVTPATSAISASLKLLGNLIATLKILNYVSVIKIIKLHFRNVKSLIYKNVIRPQHA